MKRKLILLIILIAMGSVGFWYFNKGSKAELVSPKSEQKVAVKNETTPAGGQKIPKEFKFEASTDLNTELENINPEVLDSDFSNLKSLIKDIHE